MTDTLAELGRSGMDFNNMGFTVEAWKLMQDLGIHLRMPEVGDKYGPLFIEDTAGRIVCEYDMIERRMLFRYFDHLLADLNGVSYRRIVARVTGNYRLNQEQLRKDAFRDVLQELLHAYTVKYPNRPTELFGPTWGLLVSNENRDKVWKRGFLDFENCLSLVEQHADFSTREVSVLEEHDLPAMALPGVREGLQPSILRELYGTYRWSMG